MSNRSAELFVKEFSCVVLYITEDHINHNLLYYLDLVQMNSVSYRYLLDFHQKEFWFLPCICSNTYLEFHRVQDQKYIDLLIYVAKQ